MMIISVVLFSVFFGLGADSFGASGRGAAGLGGSGRSAVGFVSTTSML